LRTNERLWAFENRLLREVFGPERDEITGDWKRMHNEGFHELYSSPNIIRVNKPRITRWAGHVARMRETIGAYRVLEGTREENRLL
jgi:hypothetical protein